MQLTTWGKRAQWMRLTLTRADLNSQAMLAFKDFPRASKIRCNLVSICIYYVDISRHLANRHLAFLHSPDVLIKTFANSLTVLNQ